MGPRCFLEERHWSQTKAQIALNRFVLLVTCCLGNYETIGECLFKKKLTDFRKTVETGVDLRLTNAEDFYMEN